MNILIATDLSESCNHATDFAKHIFKNRDVNFNLIHVYDLPLISTGIGRYETTDTILPKIQTEKRLILDKIANSFSKEVKVNTNLIYNSLTVSAIVEYATENTIDLIVMGMRQKYSMIDRLIGTITANVIKKSDIPVLVIPNKSEIKTVKHILFPTLLDVLNETEDKISDDLEFLEALFPDSLHTTQLLRITDKETIDINFKPDISTDTIYTISHNKNLEDGISKALEKFNTNMIAIEKRNHPFWENLYRSDLIRKLLYKTRIPLLVL